MNYLLVGLLALLIIWALLRWRNPEPIGDALPSGMVGLVGSAQVTFTTEGSVMVRGEIWRATSSRGIINRGDKVRVVAQGDHLVLVVEAI